VVPFSLTNATSTFQLYISKTLHEYLDVVVVVYSDDVVIYLAREQDHEEHVCQVLMALMELDCVANCPSVYSVSTKSTSWDIS
jgi:hypothetical protein